jgi:hypothetical protein
MIPRTAIPCAITYLPTNLLYILCTISQATEQRTEVDYHHAILSYTIRVSDSH